jgi:hypothetical protein
MTFDFSDVRPGVVNAMIIFGIVAVTVPLAKWVLNRYPLPGLTSLVNAI